jgi:hypothetical protein
VKAEAHNRCSCGAELHQAGYWQDVSAAASRFYVEHTEQHHEVTVIPRQELRGGSDPQDATDPGTLRTQGTKRASRRPEGTP